MEVLLNIAIGLAFYACSIGVVIGVIKYASIFKKFRNYLIKKS